MNLPNGYEICPSTIFCDTNVGITFEFILVLIEKSVSKTETYDELL